MSIKVLGINHIGLATQQNDQLQNFLSQYLGLSLLGQEHVKTQGTETIMYASCHHEHQNDGDHVIPRLEILKATSETSPIARYLSQRKAGIHHIALEVENIDEAITFLQKNNVQLTSDEPQAGAHHTRVIFIHPKETGGILIELVERLKT